VDHLLRASLTTLLRELLEGPPGPSGFVLNPGDPGLLASLERLSANAASARPGGRSSVAAHVDHLRYGIGLLNRWSRGEDPWADANYAESWRRQVVSDVEWRSLRDALGREARQWMSAIAQPRELDETALDGIIGSIVHLAYHLGAIRQIAPDATGPPARD
jgi:hypothetical protein